MKRGCLGRIVFTFVLLVCFGGSTYFWFTYFVRGRSVGTPNLVGKGLADARAFCSDLGLILVVDGTRDRPSNGVAKGAVVWQNRTPGSLIKRGTRIHIGQSLGPTILSVPDLAGQSPRTALLRFSQRNLKLGNIAYVPWTGTNGIIAEEPPSGTVVSGETAISLLVGFPPDPQKYVMPDLIDKSLEYVRPVLESRGLQVTNVRFESYPGISEGTIIRQFPQVGSAVSSKDAITLVVTRNEGSLAVPMPPAQPETTGTVPPA
jgi:serine/threonine-protein kinase